MLLEPDEPLTRNCGWCLRQIGVPKGRLVDLPLDRTTDAGPKNAQCAQAARTAA
jgi:hypothetical protein